MDEDLGIHHLDPDSAIGVPKSSVETITRQFAALMGMGQTVTENLTALLSGDILIDPQLPRAYQSLQPHLPEIHSILIVPLMVSGRSIGELVIGSSQRNFFEAHDVQSLSSAADQIAGALDRSGKLNQTDQGLQQRIEQLTTLNRITRKIKFHPEY